MTLNLKMVVLQGKAASKAAKEAFDEYDLDGNGYLEKSDLKRVRKQ